MKQHKCSVKIAYELFGQSLYAFENTIVNWYRVSVAKQWQ